MVVNQSKVKAIDNSNAKQVRFLKALKKSYKASGTLGDVFIGIVDSVKAKKGKYLLKKGIVVYCLLAREGKIVHNNFKKTGIYYNIGSGNSGAFILRTYQKSKNSYNFYGSRVFGPLSNSLFQKKHYKLRGIGDFFFY